MKNETEEEQNIQENFMDQEFDHEGGNKSDAEVEGGVN